ncbi:MAG: hypothetical protein AB7S26_12030 [Sandaracinaceae bacterium]
MRAVGPGLLVVASLVACGARTELSADDAAEDAPPIEFPFGTYLHCARGSSTAPPSVFLDAAGFEQGATLELAPRGDGVVSATYRDIGGEAHTLDFAITSATSATLSPEGQTLTGYTGLCVLGIGFSNEVPFDAELTASGSLTYDTGTVFIALDGVVAGDGGECGPLSAPGTAWLICDDGPIADPVEPAPPPTSAIPLGEHACVSQIATEYHDGESSQFALNGSAGVLTVTRTDDGVSATYEGDPALSGTLRLRASTGTSATLSPGATLTGTCDVPISLVGRPPPPTPQTIPLTSGVLDLEGGVLVLELAATMDERSSCATADKAISLICRL